MDRVETLSAASSRRGAQVYETFVSVLRATRRTLARCRMFCCRIRRRKDADSTLHLRRKLLCLRRFKIVTQRFECANAIADCDADLIVLCSSDRISSHGHGTCNRVEDPLSHRPRSGRGQSRVRGTAPSRRHRRLHPYQKQSNRSSYDLAAAVRNQGLEMRPDFSKIDYKPTAKQSGAPERKEWLSPEHVPVKSFYARDDLRELEHLEYAAGIAPFPAVPPPRCTSCSPGPFGNTPGSPPRKSPMRFTAAILPPASAALRRLRPCYPPRIRLGPQARHWRCGRSRRRHRFRPRHEDPVQPDSSRSDVGLDDHERRGASHHGVLLIVAAQEQGGPRRKN